jgi:hypothetical protein
MLGVEQFQELLLAFHSMVAKWHHGLSLGVGFYRSLFRHRALSTFLPSELVECLFAGAGRCVVRVFSDIQNKRPALACSGNLLLRAILAHHLHSFLPRSKRKRDYLLFSLGGSRLRYWLCPSLLSAHVWGGLQSLYTSFGVIPFLSAHSSESTQRVKTLFAYAELRRNRVRRSSHSGDSRKFRTAPALCGRAYVEYWGCVAQHT